MDGGCRAIKRRGRRKGNRGGASDTLGRGGNGSGEEGGGSRCGLRRAGQRGPRGARLEALGRNGRAGCALLSRPGSWLG
jgi:hypothetical protein